MPLHEIPAVHSIIFIVITNIIIFIISAVLALTSFALSSEVSICWRIPDTYIYMS